MDDEMASDGKTGEEEDDNLTTFSDRIEKAMVNEALKKG